MEELELLVPRQFLINFGSATKFVILSAGFATSTESTETETESSRAELLIVTEEFFEARTTVDSLSCRAFDSVS